MSAGRVVAHQAARGFDGGFIAAERREKFAESAGTPGVLLKFRQHNLLK
jgi:hypothetical protein